MTARGVVSCVFLALAVLVVAASAAGVLTMPGAARKLHYVTPATVVAPVFVTAAILAAGGLDYATGQSVIALGLMLLGGPFLSHATIRAIRAREERQRAQRPREERPREKESRR